MRLLAILLAAALTACGERSRAPAPLSDTDREAILAVDSEYVGAWLRDDTAAVMATLMPDAVLLPAGRRPLVGHEAIRAYWWPRDGSRTKILEFVSRADEVGGNGEVAFLRGTDSLRYTYAKDTIRLDQTSRAMSLSVLVRSTDGRWRVARKMWGPLSP